MLELAQPLWLLLLPGVAAWGWLASRRSQEGGQGGWVLRHPQLPAPASEAKAPLPAPHAPAWLAALGLALIVLALAQPREVGRWITPPPEGRDIVLVIDTSRTMSIDDFRVDGRPVERLAVLKDVMSRFVQGREGDRFGVIAFGTHAATLTPPTFDRRHVVAQIARLQVGMAGNDTALGDALGLALKPLRPQRLRPALILVSDDAASNAGDLTPAEAVAIARQLGVAIHTVQIGADLFAEGRELREEPDPQPNLAAIARLTGGRHWFVRGTGDAETVIRDIGALEQTLARPARHREVREWYWAALALGALCLSLARVMTMRQAA